MLVDGFRHNIMRTSRSANVHMYIRTYVLYVYVVISLLGSVKQQCEA